VQARAFEFPDHPEWGVTYWDWSLTPLLDASGEVGAIVFSLQDVTDRRGSDTGRPHLAVWLGTAPSTERRGLGDRRGGLGPDRSLPGVSQFESPSRYLGIPGRRRVDRGGGRRGRRARRRRLCRTGGRGGLHRLPHGVRPHRHLATIVLSIALWTAARS